MYRSKQRPLPMTQAKDFEVHWGSLAPAAEDGEYVKNSAKCRSPLLRARYEVCGAPLHGQLDDQPRKFELNPLTGQPEQAINFEVWPKNPGGWDLNSAPHKVDIRFVGVDSPIAWAARREGCSTLENASAAVAASADAACHLLRNYTDPCRPLCQLMDEQSFGAWGYGAPLMSERGLAQAMTCHLEACREKYVWRFRDGIFFLENHSAQASSKAILGVASKPGGLEFVKSLHQGFKAMAKEGEEAKRTYEEVLQSFAKFGPSLLMLRPSKLWLTCQRLCQSCCWSIGSLRVALCRRMPWSCTLWRRCQCEMLP